MNFGCFKLKEKTREAKLTAKQPKLQKTEEILQIPAGQTAAKTAKLELKPKTAEQ